MRRFEPPRFEDDWQRRREMDLRDDRGPFRGEQPRRGERDRDDRPPWGRDDDRPRHPDFHGSEVDYDRSRDDDLPRYHGHEWAPEPPRGQRYDHMAYPPARRAGQGIPDINTPRELRRYGADPLDDGEVRRYRGGWDRADDRAPRPPWERDPYGLETPPRGYLDARQMREIRRAPVYWSDDDHRRGGTASPAATGMRRHRW